MGQTYQPLHQKYRPQRFDQLVGQQAIATTLVNALRRDRIAPAYLFCGPRGTGKTSSARILARSLNCVASSHPTAEPCGTCDLCTSIAAGNALDVIEIDAASNTGVDNIRELIERSRFAPVQARWKVYVVDECHMLSTAAFNALLKTLEEPPRQVVFILATTDPQRVLPTILSRCQRFDFRRIALEPLESHLRWIAGEEGIAITEEALRVVAQRAQGGLRDAESLLDQLSLLPAPIEAMAVWELLGVVPEKELMAMAEAMAAAEPLGVVQTSRELLDRGREPGAVLQGLASLLRDLLLAGVAPDRLELTSVSVGLRESLPELARRIGKARLLLWQAQLKGSEQQLRHSAQPRLWLEVLLLGLLAEPTATAASLPAARSVRQPGPAQTGQPGAAGPASGSGRDGPTASPSPAAAGAHATPSATTPPAPPPQAVPAQAVPAQAVAPVAATTPDAPPAQNLPELWQQILARLELPSTRMLLSQQAQLVRLDERRAVVRVATTWMAMVQSRKALVEQAVVAALGSPRLLELEGGGEHQPPTAQAPAPAAQAAQPTAAPGPSSGQASHPLPTAAAAPAPAAPTAGPLPAGRPAAPAEPSPASSIPTSVGSSNTPAAAPAAAPLATPAATSLATSVLDEKARRLAEFFNGEVIQDTGDLVA